MICLTFAALLWWHSTLLEVMIEKVFRAPESRKSFWVLILHFLVMPSDLTSAGSHLLHLPMLTLLKNKSSVHGPYADSQELVKTCSVMIVGALRDVSAVDSIGCFFRGLRFSSHYPHDNL